MTDIDDEPTALDTLRTHRLACQVGIAAAERCASEALLARYQSDYARRAAHFRACLVIVEAQIAALPKQARRKKAK